MIKAAEDLQADRKKREDAAKLAETAARDARQAAEEQMRAADQKARQAEDAKKAFTDWELLNKDKLAGRDRADAELQALKAALTEKQQNAEATAKAVADANSARQEQAATIERVNLEIAAAQAAAETEKKRAAEEARAAARLETQRAIEEMQRKLNVLMEQAKAIDGDNGATPAAPSSTPAPLATPVKAVPTPVKAVATPAPATPGPKAAAATPQATPPTALVLNSTPAPVAMPKTATPVPSTPLPATPAPATPAPATPAPEATAKNAGENSLGMRFAPVGDVQFAIWPTRVKDFEVFAQEASVKNTTWRTPGFKQGPDHPVVNVSWIDAMAFCKWLTDKEHKKGLLPKEQIYRLPTDLEWSRGVGLADETGKTPADRDMGVPDVFPWGTQWPPPPNVGNYTGEETGSDVAIKGYDDGFAWTSPVGSFPPNKFGLYDMGGNVWQWCMDSWTPDSKSKVLRGASWYNGALKLSLLSSCRVKFDPDSSTDNYGFRVVRRRRKPAASRRH